MVRGYFLRICDESTEIFVLKANNTWDCSVLFKLNIIGIVL